MFWVIVGIIVIGLIIEAGKPKSKSRSQPIERDNAPKTVTDRLARAQAYDDLKRRLNEVDEQAKDTEKKPDSPDDIEASSASTNSALNRPHAIQPKVIPKTDSPVVREFKNRGVSSLWHMTHERNVPSIMRNGILPHTSPTLQAFNHVDISDPDVQRWRTRPDPHYGRKLHDYVPLYINPRNPMLYRRKEMQKEICLIEVSLEALDGGNLLITDGNAASHRTQFYIVPAALQHLPWDVLNANFWTDFEDGKRKACSEVLVPNIVTPKHIAAVHCFSSAQSGRLAQKGIRSVISMDKYFR